MLFFSRNPSNLMGRTAPTGFKPAEPETEVAAEEPAPGAGGGGRVGLPDAEEAGLSPKEAAAAAATAAPPARPTVIEPEKAGGLEALEVVGVTITDARDAEEAEEEAEEDERKEEEEEGLSLLCSLLG